MRPASSEALKHLGLHPAHQLHGDLPQPLVPEDVQLRVLLVELPELRQQQRRVRPGGREQAVAQHRLEDRRVGVRLRAEALPGKGRRQAGQRGDLPRADLLRRLELLARIAPDLRHLFLVFLSVPAAIAQGVADPQPAAGELYPAQAPALRVAGDLEDLGGKDAPVGAAGAQTGERLEQRIHPVKLQPGAEEAGEELPPGDHGPQVPVRQLSALQILLHGRLAAHGKALVLIRRGVREVHAALAQTASQLVHDCGFLAAGQVHLGHKDEAGHPVAPQQAPERLRMGLHAVRAADDQQRAVEHLQAALRLRREIDMSRRVQQRQLAVPEGQHRLLGEDRDAALALETVGIQKAVPVIDAPQFFQFSREVQKGLAERGLPRVHMGKHPEHRVFFVTHGWYCISFYSNNQQGRHFSSFRQLIYITRHFYAIS